MERFIEGFMDEQMNNGEVFYLDGWMNGWIKDEWVNRWRERQIRYIRIDQ